MHKHNEEEFSSFYNPKRDIKVNFISKSNELKLFNYLHDKCKSRLKDFETSIEEDLRILSEKQLSYNENNCIKLRICEKEVLQFFISFSKSIPILIDFSINVSLSLL